MGQKGWKISLPSVCDLLRKMVLARGWSEGLYSMGRSAKRNTRIDPLRLDLKPKWVATTAVQQPAPTEGSVLWSRNTVMDVRPQHIKTNKQTNKQTEKLIQVNSVSYSVSYLTSDQNETHGSLVNTLGMFTPVKQEVPIMWKSTSIWKSQWFQNLFLLIIYEY